MTIGCTIWMICLKLNWFFYGPSRMLQFSEFVWALSYLVWDVLNKFLLIDATDRSRISGDQNRFFIALSLYPLSFFANTPFNKHENVCQCFYPCFQNIKGLFGFHFSRLLPLNPKPGMRWLNGLKQITKKTEKKDCFRFEKENKQKI